MIVLRYLLILAGAGLLTGAGSIIAWDLYRVFKRQSRQEGESASPLSHVVRWRLAAQLAGWSLVPWLAGSSIAVVRSGFAAVKVNQFSGTRPETLYPGVHFVVPAVESIALYPTREHVFTTSTGDAPKKSNTDIMRVQTRGWARRDSALSDRSREARLYSDEPAGIARGGNDRASDR